MIDWLLVARAVCEVSLLVGSAFLLCFAAVIVGDFIRWATRRESR
jgi:hypothetical protein